MIQLFLWGGPAQQETFDPKPDAPLEIRGEFRPIETNVPGIEICDRLPNLAKLADKFTLIRSLIGFRDDHNTHWCTTGWESHPAMEASPIIAGFPPGDWPSIGSPKIRLRKTIPILRKRRKGGSWRWKTDKFLRLI